MNFEVLTYQPIDISAVLSTSHSPGTGGIVLFSGEVRNANKGRIVRYMEYEAYEAMAKKKISEIVEYAKDKWHLNMAICIHRLGRLEISECAVLVITASMHRSEAYDANRYIIDKVKTEVPIWKTEYFEDGTEEWGNSECSCGVGQLNI